VTEEGGNDKRLVRLPGGSLGKPLWSAEEWEELSRDERRRLVTWVMEMINADASDALEAGTLGLSGSEHVSRIVSLVDEQGWQELARIQDDALEASLVAKAAAAERLAESGEDGMPVLSAMLCFEMAEHPSGSL
jgi:hypothetical protein